MAQHISRWRANLFEPVAICHCSNVAEAVSPASCVSCEPEGRRETVGEDKEGQSERVREREVCLVHLYHQASANKTRTFLSSALSHCCASWCCKAKYSFLKSYQSSAKFYKPWFVSSFRAYCPINNGGVLLIQHLYQSMWVLQPLQLMSAKSNCGKIKKSFELFDVEWTLSQHSLIVFLILVEGC